MMLPMPLVALPIVESVLPALDAVAEDDPLGGVPLHPLVVAIFA